MEYKHSLAGVPATTKKNLKSKDSYQPPIKKPENAKKLPRISLSDDQIQLSYFSTYKDR